jgi:hypothetical protein
VSTDISSGGSTVDQVFVDSSTSLFACVGCQQLPCIHIAYIALAAAAAQVYLEGDDADEVNKEIPGLTGESLLAVTSIGHMGSL